VFRFVPILRVHPLTSFFLRLRVEEEEFLLSSAESFSVQSCPIRYTSIKAFGCAFSPLQLIHETCLLLDSLSGLGSAFYRFADSILTHPNISKFFSFVPTFATGKQFFSFVCLQLLLPLWSGRESIVKPYGSQKDLPSRGSILSFKSSPQPFFELSNSRTSSRRRINRSSSFRSCSYP